MIAISPELVAGGGWVSHSEKFLEKLEGLDGLRMPGERRHKNRLNKGPRSINKELLSKIRNFL